MLAFVGTPAQNPKCIFCILLSVRLVRMSKFWSTRIVVSEIHSTFNSVMFGFALPGVDRWFHCSDIYGCVSSWKPCAVVTGSWQVQEKSK